jgi:hypothetical protein
MPRSLKKSGLRTEMIQIDILYGSSGYTINTVSKKSVRKLTGLLIIQRSIINPSVRYDISSAVCASDLI